MTSSLNNLETGVHISLSVADEPRLLQLCDRDLSRDLSAEYAEYRGNTAHGAAWSAFRQRLHRNEVPGIASVGELRWTQRSGKARLRG